MADRRSQRRRPEVDNTHVASSWFGQDIAYHHRDQQYGHQSWANTDSLPPSSKTQGSLHGGSNAGPKPPYHTQILNIGGTTNQNHSECQANTVFRAEHQHFDTFHRVKTYIAASDQWSDVSGSNIPMVGVDEDPCHHSPQIAFLADWRTAQTLVEGAHTFSAIDTIRSLTAERLSSFDVSSAIENTHAHLQREAVSIQAPGRMPWNNSMKLESDHANGNPNFAEFDFLELDDQQTDTNIDMANAEPWNLFQPNTEACFVEQEEMSRGLDQQTPSDTTHSTYAFDNASSDIREQDLTASVSSAGPNMMDSMTTERPLPSTNANISESGPSSIFNHVVPVRALPPYFQYRIEASALPQPSFSDLNPDFDSHDLPPEPDYVLLAPPGRDALSDVPSSPTDASSPAAPDVLDCPEMGCDVSFRGAYRKGNLARHRRHRHNGPEFFPCGDPGCEKNFHRKDARLKHHRNHHPNIAVGPCIPRGRQARPTNQDQDTELSNISSWT